ncbi:UNVERIFIED_CONTAM: hypothetical protein GTU68_018985 [Idotea baltica]|nr:hypothetical protein [Idotea baltica]
MLPLIKLGVLSDTGDLIQGKSHSNARNVIRFLLRSVT